MSTVNGVAQQLDQDALVRLYILDLSPLNGPVMRFTDAHNGILTFDGEIFTPTDIEFSGLEVNNTDSTQYPAVKLAHMGTPAVGYLDDYDDLIGAIFIRYRTYARFLDTGAEPDPSQMFPPDKFYVERLSHLDSTSVEWELRPLLSIGNRFLPKRMVLARYCDFIYRKWDTNTASFKPGTCPYSGGAYYDESGNSVGLASQDRCSKLLDTGCKIRFGETTPLPYRGFPGLRRVR